MIRGVAYGVSVRQSSIPMAGNDSYPRDLITEYDGKVITPEEAGSLQAIGRHTHCRSLCFDDIIDGLPSE